MLSADAEVLSAIVAFTVRGAELSLAKANPPPVAAEASEPSPAVAPIVMPALPAGISMRVARSVLPAVSTTASVAVFCARLPSVVVAAASAIAPLVPSLLIRTALLAPASGIVEAGPRAAMSV